MLNTPRRSYAEIDLEAFRWNYKQIRKRVNRAKMCAVVKANAYGHGLEVIVKELVNLGAESLCVGFVQEGMDIRRFGVKIPILVLVPAEKGEIENALNEELELTVCSFDNAREISDNAVRLSKKAAVHIYVDTGMYRAGLKWDTVHEELHKIKELPGINIKGLYTHFATAYWEDRTFAYNQLERFNAVLKKLSFPVSIIHAANSAALLQVDDSFFDMVRPGLALYGYYPSLQCKRPVRLKPVMALKSYIADIQTVLAPEGIGYSLTYKIHEPTKIAAVPIGYGDGVNRLLSNNGSVLIRGKRFPISGNVSMDWIMIDLSDDNEIQIGDEVVLLGESAGGKSVSGGKSHEAITIYELCEKLHTIPYEITSNISPRLPRRYINS